MPYDIITLEVYKFAASYMNKGFGEVLRQPKLSVYDAITVIGIARNVVGFLGEVKNDADAQRLSSTLDSLTNELERCYSNRAKNSQIEVQRAQRLVAHGERGIPYVNAAIYCYAGERLEAFVGERIADESANRSLYGHCNKLKERISEFLERFIAINQSSPGMDLSQRKGRRSILADGREDGLCAICNGIQSQFVPELRRRLANLNTAIARMEQYVMHQQPAT